MTTLDGYVRISKVGGREGDSFLSPAQQRDAILGWMKRNGVQLGEMFEEMDVSGGKMKRPKLDRVLDRIESGASDGMVVAYVSRFGRSFVDGAQIVRRVREIGRFVAVDSGFDTATTEGNLLADMQLVMAEEELRRIRSNWNDSRRRAVERGIHLTTIPPFGFRRGEGGRLDPDPGEAPHVERIFSMRASGAAWSEIRAYLHEQGQTTRRDKDFSLRALKDIIRSTVYIGTASHGAYVRDDAHPPIVDRGLWRRAQREGTAPRAATHAPSPLIGLVRCAGCRYGVRSTRREAKSGPRLDLRCRCASEGMTETCGAPAATSRGFEIEEYLVELLLDRADVLRAEHLDASPDLSDRERDAAEAKAALDEIAGDVRAQRALGMERYVDAVEVRRRELAEAERRLDEAQLAATPIMEIDGDLRSAWSSLPVADKRRLLASAIDVVFVRRGPASAPLDQRVRVLWRGEGTDLDLPRTGRRDYVPVPYVFDEDDATVALA